MCGIAGIVGLDRERGEREVQEMIGRMPYRGPDGRGTWAEGDVALGHLRLSIIDLSDAGRQPMISPDGRFVLSFNGEIYNYLELKAELQASGSAFFSATDSEVIIEAYRRWGPDCVSHFNGMWAFALYDRREKTLLVSRDRFGVKPLFYAWEDGVLRFASEMKALLHDGKGKPNWPYLYHFFDRRTPLGSDETVFEGIRHLRPSHSLLMRDGKPEFRRYWRPDPARRTHDGDPVAVFRELMTDAVRLRLRSDVPVGVCLSGGVDSSVIATVIASMGVRPETFSTVYNEPEASEERFIDLVNAAAGANPHKLTPRSEDFFPVLEQIVAHHDEPVRMPGCFSHWHVMQCASGHVTVLLDGQGADEILGGYKELYAPYIASLIADMALLRRPGDAYARLRECIDGLKTHLGAGGPYVSEALARLLPEALRSALGAKRMKSRLFHADFLARHAREAADDAEEAALLKAFPSRLDRMMYAMFTETNLPMLLRYEDRNSMAFSLEARTPFLDYRVVEFCHGLDYRMKMRGYTTKHVMRDAFKDLLPPEVRGRTDKKGFPTPVARWLRKPLRDQVRKRLSDSPVYDLEIIDHAAAQRTLDEHMSGNADREREIFRLLTLDMWLRKYAA